MSYRLLILFVILPGLAGIMIFGYFALIDWNTLQQAYNYFDKVVQDKSTLETLFVAEAQQNIHQPRQGRHAPAQTAARFLSVPL